MSSSPPDLDRLRDLADDIRVVREVTEDVGVIGDLICTVGVGIGVVTCITGGVFEFVQLGLDGVGLIGTDLVCLVCLAWVVRSARSRSRARGVRNRLAWNHTGLARLLGVAVQLFLPPEVRWIKWEEWCAELACIDSRWEKTVYLLGLLGKMYGMARTAREGKRKGRP